MSSTIQVESQDQEKLSKCGHCCSLCFGAISYAFYALSTFLAPAVLAVQMGSLDYVIFIKSGSNIASVIVFIIAEVGLICHMVLHGSPAQVVRSGSLQWIVYSWLISAKCGVLYYLVMPDGTELHSRIISLTPVLYCIVTFKTICHVFRGSEGGRNSQAKRSTSQPQSLRGAGGLGRDWNEHGTLDVILLQDMVWHVFLDFVDITRMIDYMTQDKLSPVMLKRYGAQVETCSMVTGVFVILALFFHQQSFPGTIYLAGPDSAASAASNSEASPRRERLAGMLPELSLGTASISMTMCDFRSNMTHTGTTGTVTEPFGQAQRQQQQHQRRRDAVPAPEYRVDVVKARKRSAIVSILLVDLPFLSLRVLMYLYGYWSFVQRDEAEAGEKGITNHYEVGVTTNSTAGIDLGSGLLIPALFDPGGTASNGASGGDGTASHLEPQFEIFMLKNLVCLLLQAMQLRFVQQADLERSQNLKWMDVHQSESSATHSVARRRQKVKGPVKDPSLRNAWDDWDRLKRTGRREVDVVNVDSIVEDEEEEMRRHVSDQTGNSPLVPRHQSVGIFASVDSFSRALSPVASERTLSSTSEVSEEAQGLRGYLCGALMCCCCCSRQRHQQGLGRRCVRRCFSCDCSKSIFLHIIMGIVLGWLIAKVDFDQMFEIAKVAAFAEQAS